MDKTAPTRSRKVLFWIRILKGLFFYAFVPLVLLLLLAGPVSRAVRNSEPAVWLILLTALGAVVVNWIIYSLIRRKRPSLLVFSHGIFCLLLVLIVEAEALLDNDAMSSVLTMAGGLLVLLLSILFYFWLASCHSKAAHMTAVIIRVMLDITLCIMAYRIWRDIETGISDADTWTTAGVILMILLGFQLPGIVRAVRRSASRRRATGMAEGRILQIVGETRLDRDGDSVTSNVAYIHYTVDGTDYETRADISRFTTRLHGKDTFVGHKIPVFYHPDNPSETYIRRISKRMLIPEPEEDKNLP